MSKTPFYKVSIGQRDITELVSMLTYEDAVDVDNYLTLQIQKDALKLLDQADVKEGKLLTFLFGYLQGLQSPKYVSRISNITSNYQETTSITLNCTDLGLLLKKNESKRDWKSLTASQIVEAIADIYGLTAVVDRTDKVYSFMPQGGRSDYNFLKYLASIQPNGSYRFFMKHNSIYFTKLNLDQDSIKTFVYNSGDGEVIAFRPFSRETTKSNAARDTVITSVDPFTNQPRQQVINDSTIKDDTKLSDYPAYIYDSNSTELSGPAISGKRPSKVQTARQDTNRAGLHVVTPNYETDEVDGEASLIKKDSAKDQYMGDLKTLGLPNILSDMIITMDGVSKRDSGNWYINRAKHMLTPQGGYVMDLTMKKNATQKPVSGVAKFDNVNNTVGNKSNQDKNKSVGVYTYDKDAILISSPDKK